MNFCAVGGALAQARSCVALHVQWPVCVWAASDDGCARVCAMKGSAGQLLPAIPREQWLYDPERTRLVATMPEAGRFFVSAQEHARVAAFAL